MRISSDTMNNISINSMQNSYSKYANILSKIASGKNFDKISDNITDAVDVLKIKNQLSQMEDYQGNIQHAINEMNIAYDTLGSVTNELTSINGLITQAANATTTEESAKAIGTEISQRVDTVKDLMNTKYLNNYIFSGTYVQQKTYDTDEEGNIVYKGSAKSVGDRNVTISANTKFAYNLTGEEIFGKQDGVNDFFSQMNDLYNLLNNPDEETGLDYDKIREKLGVLEKAINNVTQQTGSISAKVSKLTSTQEINADTITSLTEKRANLEEVDIVKAASELANANTALQASYMLGANVLSSVSLLDYL